MSKHKKKAGKRFDATANPVKYHVIDLEPEELASYVQRAEEYILPLVQEAKLDAGGTQFLLAQYTRALITGNAPFDLENATVMANTVLTLWQTGHYTPSSKYPYTLEETLLCIHEEPDNNVLGVRQSQHENTAFLCDETRRLVRKR